VQNCLLGTGTEANDLLSVISYFDVASVAIL